MSAAECRAARCAGRGHPGVTYNPWLNQTWCACGQHTYPGRPETVDQHLACCGGPLTEGAADA